MTAKKARLVTLCIALVLAFGLFGCAGGSSGNGSKETLTPSSIVNADKQLLFVADDIAKDSPAQLYIFENGTLTFRSNTAINLGDLVELSDEEIEAAYREAEEKSRQEKHDYSNTFYEFTVAPKVASVELYTDKSGNVVERECVVLEGYEAQQVSEGEATVKMSGSTWSHSFNLEFWLIVEPEPVFDGYFGGFGGSGYTGDNGNYLLVKLDDATAATFAWDEIGAEGTVAK